MSDYIFCAGKGHLPQLARDIALEHGVELVNHTDAGCRCGKGCTKDCPACARHWFACPDDGNPFNRDTAASVAKDLAAAGLKN